MHPSFQMSFAATLALVAGLRARPAVDAAGADTPLGARIALWGGREIVALILASLRRRHSPPRPTWPIISTASRPTACSPTCWRCRSSRRWVMPAGMLGAGRDAVRLRRAALAADGARHRLDDRGRAVGREPARRGRAHHGLRHRAAAARHGGLVLLACCARRCAGAAAAIIWRRRVWAVRAPLPDVLRRRPTATLSRCAAATGRLVGDAHRQQRHLRGARMARRRRRRAHAEGCIARAGRRLRRDRLHRRGSPTARWWRCRSPRKPSRRIAAAPRWWSASAPRRRPAPRPRSTARSGSAPARCALYRIGEGLGDGASRFRRATTGPGRAARDRPATPATARPSTRIGAARRNAARRRTSSVGRLTQ